jgi:hypothetical protein
MGEIISPTNQRTPSSVGKIDDLDVSASASGALAEASPSTEGSTPDIELDHELELADHDLDLEHQDDVKQLPAPPQKRKGGRKPVSFALSEKHVNAIQNSPY